MTLDGGGIRDGLGEKADDAKVQAFRRAPTGRTAEVTARLDSFGDEPMSEEAGHFTYMLQALDEMGLRPD